MRGCPMSDDRHHYMYMYDDGVQLHEFSRNVLSTHLGLQAKTIFVEIRNKPISFLAIFALK
jgi:hypothetical protein